MEQQQQRNPADEQRDLERNNADREQSDELVQDLANDWNLENIITDDRRQRRDDDYGMGREL